MDGLYQKLSLAHNVEYAVVSFFASACFFGFFFFKVEMNACVIYASQIIIFKSIGLILELYFALLTLQKRQT